MSGRLAEAVDQAIAEGLLPAGTTCPSQETRPWPVVLLTGLGAWLAAVPLLGMVALILGDWISSGVGSYFIGALVLACAVALLRAKDLPLFVEQLAVPGLLVGGGSLAFGIFRDLPQQGAAGLLALLAVAVALGIARVWLRVLLSALAAALLTLALLPERYNLLRHDAVAIWYSLDAVLLLGFIAIWLQRLLFSDGAKARVAAAIESIGSGWFVFAVTGLALASGRSFLVGGVLGGGSTGPANRNLVVSAGEPWVVHGTQAISVLMTITACAWAARQWPGLRVAMNAPVAVVLILLAWFMPAWGGVLLVLAASATTQRHRLAAAAALAAAWVLGSFYYALQWPLAHKALVLAACGVVLGAMAWIAREQWRTSIESARVVSPGRTSWLIIVAGLATLVTVNFGIWQKEKLIAEGRPVFVELAPVDPRSLMQGDYMRLDFRLPTELTRAQEDLLGRVRPQVVVRLDARGVAALLRVHRGDTPLAAEEFLIEMTPKGGRWTLVSDAWFFREGEAKRWEQARYGEFRVAADGRALLVGLADGRLKAIRPLE